MWRPLPHQIEPEGEWFIWIMQWGAGSGKTFTGSQMVRQWCDSGEAKTVNVAGPTWVDTMRTMVHGTADAPGLIGVWPEHQRPVLRASKDDPHLRTHNGAKIQLFSAQKAERFRGAAGDKAWYDEIDAWKPEQMTPREAFALGEQRIRTGPKPQIICTTTPKRHRIVAYLRKRKDCVVTRATLFDNADNLAPAYVAAMIEEYEGTRLGRQELRGELLDEVEGAIVTMEMIDAARLDVAEAIERVVVGVDPFGGGGDACGISAAAKCEGRAALVLADRTCKLGPDGWGRRAIETAIEFDADCIAWEANYGGDMVESVLRHAMDVLGAEFRLKRVWASKAKHLAFEPLGQKYERHEVHHVGTFQQLEDEVTQFTPIGYEGAASPNRADSLVFAMAELFPKFVGMTFDDINAMNAGEEMRE